VLATGGIGRLYSHTTNPAIATGDGIALAEQAGADIENMEFIQFHPTAFYAGGELHFLISEALRGEGGILRDGNGEPFARKYHPDGELAPRDIVTRAIYAEMQAAGMPHMYLDISHLPDEVIERRFPTILANCLNFGIDIRKDRIPVAPAAHYLMGGITVDVNGRTSVAGLSAVGETASTGLHGANRLASNSLLECVVLARRVAADVSAGKKAQSGDFTPPGNVSREPREYRFASNPEIQAALDELHRLMWECVGILRDEQGLNRALARIQTLTQETQTHQWARVIPSGAELHNQLVVARLVTEASLRRQESRGAHYRTDFPEHPAVPDKSPMATTRG
jgi:L-aspartate oxidase